MNRSDLSIGAFGDEVADLHQKLLALGVEVPAGELERRFFGPATRDALQKLQTDHRARVTGSLDDQTRAILDSAVSARVQSGDRQIALQLPEIPSITLPNTKPVVDPDAIHEVKPLDIPDVSVSDVTIKPYRVEGKVASRISNGVGGLRVVIVDKGVGGDVQLAQATTDKSGAYQITFPASDVRKRGKEQPDLQVRVYAGDIFLGASAVRYGAKQVEKGLDIVVQAEKLPRVAEYPRLVGKLGTHFGELNEPQFKQQLAALKEDEQRQDITYLANKTGWDARMVAMAALANQFAERSDVRPEFYYALFRSGIPANEAVLAQMDSKVVKQVWEQAVDQDILPAELKAEIADNLAKFTTYQAEHLLEEATPIGISSFQALIAVTLDNADQQKRLAQLYYEKHNDLGEFWASVSDEFPNEVDRLKLNGKLSLLTINNAPLIQQLHAKWADLNTPLDLVKHGLYQREGWEKLLDGGIPIPTEIPGDTPEDKKTYYATFMANQVRLSYPTAVVSDMVKDQVIPLSNQSVQQAVTGFLDDHQGQFELNLHPIEHYLDKHGLTLDGAALGEIVKLQRVGQISPSFEVMGQLMKHHLDSAYAMVRYDERTFVSRYKDALGGERLAQLTYAKAHQIHHAMLNIATSYLLQKSAVPMYGVDNLPALQKAKVNNGAAKVVASPTLENIFGEMDYCACEHCRSWLSPAAYLVDLLLYLEGQDPELPDPPLSVLLERRPDIQHLQLTCENTNTVLPYIDLVNEILEHHVVNNSLDQFVGHNTEAGMTTEELLATPQFVNDAAYTLLRAQMFPPPLPFHQALEALRRYYDHFDIPLHEAMERLRKNDAIERAGNETDPDYGWWDILMERLQLSRPEYEILTNSQIPLSTLYGEAPGMKDEDFIEQLSNAKTFARRLNLTYEELADIACAPFINPNSQLIPKLEKLGARYLVPQLEKLGIGLKEIRDYVNGTLSEAQFMALLPANVDASAYGDDIKQWARDNYQHIADNLGVNFRTIQGIHDGAITATDLKMLVPLHSLDIRPYGGQTQQTEDEKASQLCQWLKDHYDQIMGLILLTDLMGGEDVCSFDSVEWRYALPDPKNNHLRPVEFLKLLRFVRLWRRLGWSIEYTALVIEALYPTDQYPKPSDSDETAYQMLDSGFRTLLVRLAHLQAIIQQLNLSLKRDLAPLLASWSPIETYGERSLYRQMFLNPTILALDSVFSEDGYGGYLSDRKEYQDANAKPTLSGHTEALRAAFSLTQEEFDLILEALSFNKDTTLNLANISAIFRHGYLARKLSLSVKEFLALKTLSGLDPFAPLDLVVADPESDMSLGSVRPPAIRFIELAKRIKDSPLKISQLLYLLQHEDLSGKASPPQADILALAQTLRRDLLRIDGEHTVQDDPNGEIAKTKMGLVYGSEATDVFFGLLNNTVVFRADYSQATPALTKDILDVTDLIDYDYFQKRLSFRGAMTTQEKDSLCAAASATNEFQTAVQVLFEAGQKFFESYPELRPLHDAYLFFKRLQTFVIYQHDQASLDTALVEASAGRLSYDHARHQLGFTGVLDSGTAEKIKNVAGTTNAFNNAIDTLFTQNQAAINNLFVSYPNLASQKEAYLKANDSEAQQRSVLLANFLPMLRLRLKSQHVRQTVSAQVNADLGIVTALLENVTLLHAAAELGAAAINDFLLLETQGLSADIYFADHVSGPASQPSHTVSTLAYPQDDVVLPHDPAHLEAPVSGVWYGFLEAPDNGFYNFYIIGEASAQVSLTLDGTDQELEANNGVWQNKNPIELKAGRLYELKLTVLKVQKKLALRWECTGMGQALIPAAQLYPAVPLEHFKASYLRQLKALALAEAFELSDKELAYLATAPVRNAATQEGWLNALPTQRVPVGVEAPTLWNVVTLLQYSTLKTSLKVRDERLLGLLQDPEVKDEDGELLLNRVTGWARADYAGLLTHFNLTAVSLKDLDQFVRLHEAFKVVKELGISAGTLAAHTTNEPSADQVRALQAALRARYDPTAWLKVLQPINDELRERQRDALVVSVLHRLGHDDKTKHIDTPDKLFEHFLIDAQMAACMKTSRIKQAISSVQLFIQRCLLNLEESVDSATLNAQRWEWMKRYRVWEANRKVFLWPENWLEPELRDNKSPFFKDLESELLQSDITDDAAATALVHYLGKLDEVAKLEICGMYYEEGEDGNEADDKVHVIARTAGARRTYYYRRQDGGLAWTPWGKIDLNIEDTPVLPVVWKGRLFLFWLSVRKEGESAPGSDSELDITKKIKVSTLKNAAGEARTRVTVDLYWSEYYHKKWQPPRSSDVNGPLMIGSFPSTGNGTFDRAKIELSSATGQQGELCVNIEYGSLMFACFKLYTTHGLPTHLQENWDIAEEIKLLESLTAALGVGNVNTLDDIDKPSFIRGVQFGQLGWMGIRRLKTTDKKLVIELYKSSGGPLNVINSKLDLDVLRNLPRDHTASISPQHPVSNFYVAPFFLQDSQHVFYVKPAALWVPIEVYGDIAVWQPAVVVNVEIPPLVEGEIPWHPEDYMVSPDLNDPTVIGPQPPENLVGDISRLYQVINMSGTIRFGNQLIGPGGNLNIGKLTQ